MFGDDVAWTNNIQGAEETDIESGAHNESEQRLRQVKKVIKVVWNDLTWYSGDVVTPTWMTVFPECVVCQLGVAKASHLWFICFSCVWLLSVHVVVVSDDHTVEMGAVDVDARRLYRWMRRRRRCPLLSTAAAAPYRICNTWTKTKMFPLLIGAVWVLGYV